MNERTERDTCAKKKKKVHQGDKIRRIFAYLANFRLLGDCFLLSVFGKLQKEYNFLFPPLSSVNAMLDKFRQNGLGCTLGDFCSQSHLVTLKAAQVKT
jgi:hypothetical protein